MHEPIDAMRERGIHDMACPENRASLELLRGAAHSRADVKHGTSARDGSIDGFRIAEIPEHHLDVRIVVPAGRGLAPDERTDAVAVLYEPLDETAAHHAACAGHEDVRARPLGKRRCPRGLATVAVTRNRFGPAQ